MIGAEARRSRALMKKLKVPDEPDAVHLRMSSLSWPTGLPDNLQRLRILEPRIYIPPHGLPQHLTHLTIEGRIYGAIPHLPPTLVHLRIENIAQLGEVPVLPSGLRSLALVLCGLKYELFPPGWALPPSLEELCLSRSGLTDLDVFGPLPPTLQVSSESFPCPYTFSMHKCCVCCDAGGPSADLCM